MNNYFHSNSYWNSWRCADLKDNTVINIWKMLINKGINRLHYGAVPNSSSFQLQHARKQTALNAKTICEIWSMWIQYASNCIINTDYICVFPQVSMTSVVWLKVHEMRTEQVSPQHLKTSPQGSRTSTPTKNYPPHTPTDRSVLVVDQYINIQHLPGFVFRYEYYPVRGGFF